ncbi:hypothetical protein CLHOM_15810 [Clostridium homopropionicum DSM 5847]|uniref:Uncharacterized protein n=1 Tax=Clostridium homopropionicum DSM 5847 TaxID=1121318 RepID=A0A0L6ZAL3_9CLOT|nr:hypothetical protein [Clostridium homopropionicum]KOA20016.1 hypothetical protein CLHOM_15810 [Clostridium homopropionicum DSM 5847]SFG64810.1 hypothetical protein SAMN04488501_11255 [Clostridium homopropionicum]
MHKYKKLMFFAAVLIVTVTGFIFSGMITNSTKVVLNETNINQNKTDENSPSIERVANLVKNFGSKLQLVSLLAPEDILKKSMKENYGSLVSEALIEKWIKDPLNAPGRLTSSPWPDRIEIISILELSKDTYEVKGEIIEVTSQEKGTPKAAAKRPIKLIVKNENGWLIEDVILSPYE